MASRKAEAAGKTAPPQAHEGEDETEGAQTAPDVARAFHSVLRDSDPGNDAGIKMPSHLSCACFATAAPLILALEAAYAAHKAENPSQYVDELQKRQARKAKGNKKPENMGGFESCHTKDDEHSLRWAESRRQAVARRTSPRIIAHAFAQGRKLHAALSELYSATRFFVVGTDPLRPPDAKELRLLSTIQETVDPGLAWLHVSGVMSAPHGCTMPSQLLWLISSPATIRVFTGMALTAVDESLASLCVKCLCMRTHPSLPDIDMRREAVRLGYRIAIKVLASCTSSSVEMVQPALLLAAVSRLTGREVLNQCQMDRWAADQVGEARPTAAGTAQAGEQQPRGGPRDEPPSKLQPQPHAPTAAAAAAAATTVTGTTMAPLDNSHGGADLHVDTDNRDKEQKSEKRMGGAKDTDVDGSDSNDDADSDWDEDDEDDDDDSDDDVITAGESVPVIQMRGFFDPVRAGASNAADDVEKDQRESDAGLLPLTGALMHALARHPLSALYLVQKPSARGSGGGKSAHTKLSESADRHSTPTQRHDSAEEPPPKRAKEEADVQQQQQRHSNRDGRTTDEKDGKDIGAEEGGGSGQVQGQRRQRNQGSARQAEAQVQEQGRQKEEEEGHQHQHQLLLSQTHASVVKDMLRSKRFQGPYLDDRLQQTHLALTVYLTDVTSGVSAAVEKTSLDTTSHPTLHNLCCLLLLAPSQVTLLVDKPILSVYPLPDPLLRRMSGTDHTAAPSSMWALDGGRLPLLGDLQAPDNIMSMMHTLSLLTSLSATVGKLVSDLAAAEAAEDAPEVEAARAMDLAPDHMDRGHGEKEGASLGLGRPSQERTGVHMDKGQAAHLLSHPSGITDNACIPTLKTPLTTAMQTYRHIKNLILLLLCSRQGLCYIFTELMPVRLMLQHLRALNDTLQLDAEEVTMATVLHTRAYLVGVREAYAAQSMASLRARQDSGALTASPPLRWVQGTPASFSLLCWSPGMQPAPAETPCPPAALALLVSQHLQCANLVDGLLGHAAEKGIALLCSVPAEAHAIHTLLRDILTLVETDAHAYTVAVTLWHLDAYDWIACVYESCLRHLQGIHRASNAAAATNSGSASAFWWSWDSKEQGDQEEEKEKESDATTSARVDTAAVALAGECCEKLLLLLARQVAPSPKSIGPSARTAYTTLRRLQRRDCVRTELLDWLRPKVPKGILQLVHQLRQLCEQRERQRARLPGRETRSAALQTARYCPQQQRLERRLLCRLRRLRVALQVSTAAEEAAAAVSGPQPGIGKQKRAGTGTRSRDAEPAWRRDFAQQLCELLGFMPQLLYSTAMGSGGDASVNAQVEPDDKGDAQGEEGSSRDYWERPSRSSMGVQGEQRVGEGGTGRHRAGHRKAKTSEKRRYEREQLSGTHGPLEDQVPASEQPQGDEHGDDGGDGDEIGDDSDVGDDTDLLSFELAEEAVQTLLALRDLSGVALLDHAQLARFFVALQNVALREQPLGRVAHSAAQTLTLRIVTVRSLLATGMSLLNHMLDSGEYGAGPPEERLFPQLKMLAQDTSAGHHVGVLATLAHAVIHSTGVAGQFDEVIENNAAEVEAMLGSMAPSASAAVQVLRRCCLARIVGSTSVLVRRCLQPDLVATWQAILRLLQGARGYKEWSEDSVAGNKQKADQHKLLRHLFVLMPCFATAGVLRRLHLPVTPDWARQAVPWLAQEPLLPGRSETDGTEAGPVPREQRSGAVRHEPAAEQEEQESKGPRSTEASREKQSVQMGDKAALNGKQVPGEVDAKIKSAGMSRDAVRLLLSVTALALEQPHSALAAAALDMASTCLLVLEGKEACKLLRSRPHASFLSAWQVQEQAQKQAQATGDAQLAHPQTFGGVLAVLLAAAYDEPDPSTQTTLAEAHQTAEEEAEEQEEAMQCAREAGLFLLCTLHLHARAHPELSPLLPNLGAVHRRMCTWTARAMMQLLDSVSMPHPRLVRTLALLGLVGPLHAQADTIAAYKTGKMLLSGDSASDSGAGGQGDEGQEEEEDLMEQLDMTLLLIREASADATQNSHHLFLADDILKCLRQRYKPIAGGSCFSANNPRRALVALRPRACWVQADTQPILVGLEDQLPAYMAKSVLWPGPRRARGPSAMSVAVDMYGLSQFAEQAHREALEQEVAEARAAREQATEQDTTHRPTRSRSGQALSMEGVGGIASPKLRDSSHLRSSSTSQKKSNARAPSMHVDDYRRLHLSSSKPRQSGQQQQRQQQQRPQHKALPPNP